MLFTEEGETAMYYSHTNDCGEQELNIDHLTEVAELAASFAEVFGSGDWAYGAGIAHDIGKYSQEFQKRLLDNGRKVNHSSAGAYEVSKVGDVLLAYCIMGHHGGMPDGGNDTDVPGDSSLYGRLKEAKLKKIPNYDAYRDEVTLIRRAYPEWLPDLNDRQDTKYFSLAFLIRMVFSCLVDADYLCTERFMRGKGRANLSSESLHDLEKKLSKRIEGFYPPSNDLNAARCKVLEECRAAAAHEPGVFSLTVPTGGGKTYASMYFALNHASSNENAFRRVIYAIPYTSIIEQNAAVFRDIFGENNVLEHHANFEFDDDEDGIGNALRLASENWDAPIIATTNVQFFESFYSHKPSRCRKLHNVARSVIVLDEAQMIPTKHLKPCIAVLAELVNNYGCSVVLCTATQPALEDLFAQQGLSVQEIVTDKAGLFEQLERVEYRVLGRVSDESLAARLASSDQTLCIVNSRKQAANLFELIGGEGSFHLSTLMHPVHRESVLRNIRTRLREGEACRVVSTSLIEAGVDLDFPIVYRAYAGIDSMIQAGGRCNRENKRALNESAVYLFEPEEAYAIPNELKQTSSIGRRVLTQHGSEGFEAEQTEGGHICNIGSPNIIDDYFFELYDLRKDKLDSVGAFDAFQRCRDSKGYPFRTISQAFRMIDEGSYAVIIPTDDNKDLIEEVQRGFPSRSTMRRLSRYSVNVYDQDRKDLLKLGIIKPLVDNGKGEAVYLLSDTSRYSTERGLMLDTHGGEGIFL